MKKLLIVLIMVILLIFAYNQYKEYQRFHPENYNYKTGQNIDIEYYNQDVVYNYFEAVQSLNGFAAMQWSANKIDVKSPENDDDATQYIVEEYHKKLAKVKYYEAKLEASKQLKKEGFTNSQIKAKLEGNTAPKNSEVAEFNTKIKSMFNPSSKIRLGEKSAFIYEIQKLLVKKGYDIPVDGVYKNITQDAIYKFEEKNNLFPDGDLDVLTLDALLY
tara:strand:- start:768 stop:1418 length:651 start_codon:yes stop_codon:yes gene_type:complete